MVAPFPAQFAVGQKVQFTYHNKTRVGKVETVDNRFLRLELEPNTDPDKAVKFKSFSYDKIVSNSVVYVG
jgi:hypothetical protein